ncbi:MAG: iron ABC transporter permease [Planctomycetota bacterium]
MGVLASIVFALSLTPLLGLIPAALSGDVAKRWDRINGVLLDRLVNTIVLAAGTALLSVAVALPLVYFFHRRRFLGRSAARIFYIAPLLIPPHIHAISWMRILGRQGYLSQWLEQHDWNFAIRQGFLEIAGTETFFPGTTWISFCSFWPLAALLISSGFAQTDVRREEAARLVAGPWRTFWKIVWPEIGRHVLAGGFFVFIFAATCYAIPQLLDTPVIMVEVFFVASQVDNVSAAVVALPLVLTTLAALYWVAWSSGREIFRGTAHARPLADALRPKSIGAAIYVWGLIAVTAGWPFFSLVAKAGGLATYRFIFQNTITDLRASLILSTISAFVLVAAALPIALLCRRLGPRRGFAIEALALTAFALPAAVVGVAMNLFWGRFESISFIDTFVYRGLGLPILAYLTLFLPFAVRCIRTALARIPASATEAAEISGRSGTAIFFRILLPMLRPALIAAALLGFVLTLGELVAGLMVNPDQWQTAQSRVFNMVHFSRDEEVAALCVLIGLLALLPLSLFALFSGRKVELL